MNWRPGKLKIGTIRAFAAGKASEGNTDNKNVVVITLPLILWNSGASPLIVDDLRLIPKNNNDAPQLIFQAVDDKLTSSALEKEGRIIRNYFFLPVLIKPNEIIQANFVFQARDTDFDFQAQLYELSLEAKLSPKNDWKKLRQINLDFTRTSEMELFNLNALYSVFPFRDNENT